MIPKIEFRWSFIYQEEIHLLKNEKYNRDVWEKYVESFIHKLKKEWNKNGYDILKYMEQITGLKWKENKIICYVIKMSEFGPISDPLTIPIQLKHKKNIFTLTTKRFFDILIHELIHNLFIQNKDKLSKYFDSLINKKYKNLSWNIAIHVPVHAIHKEIFDKFFEKRRFKEEIEACSYYPEYKKAWDLVISEGSKKIIEDLRKSLIIDDFQSIFSNPIQNRNVAYFVIKMPFQLVSHFSAG